MAGKALEEPQPGGGSFGGKSLPRPVEGGDFGAEQKMHANF